MPGYRDILHKVNNEWMDKLTRRQLLFLLGDIFFISLALFLAFLIRFDGFIPPGYLSPHYLWANLLFVLCLLGSFKVFGLYNSLWSYASVDELISVVLGVTAGVVLAGLGIHFLELHVPRSLTLMMWFILVIFTGGSRLGFRVARRYYRTRFSTRQNRVLIIGAGAAGSMVLKELKENQDKVESLPVGFIDDEPEKEKMKIHGLPVLGNRQDISRVIKDYYIDEVIIAIPSAPRKVIRQIVDRCKKSRVNTRILPGVYEILNGNIELKSIRAVDIEDLLGREPVQVNLEEISGYLRGKRVLVTGAGGSIGSELCRQIAQFDPESLVLLGRGENSIFEIEKELRFKDYSFRICPVICDVRDREGLKRNFSFYQPQVIFHAAAHKHVPLMEANVEEAVKNNIYGTKNMVELADEFQASRFVQVSTDKAVNPTSVMGITKRIAEICMQATARASSTQYCAVRFGNVLGSRGSVVPIFKRQVAAGGPVTVTHPQMTRYFMTITEAVQLVIQAGAMGAKGEIFVLDMGEPVKILDMAEDLIRLSGLEPYRDIDIEFSGIRPGEKLFEELLTKREKVSATNHERIFVAEADEVNLKKFRREFWSRLTSLTQDPHDLRDRLNQIISDKPRGSYG